MYVYIQPRQGDRGNFKKLINLAAIFGVRKKIRAFYNARKNHFRGLDEHIETFDQVEAPA